jgi:hypothetical protein
MDPVYLAAVLVIVVAVVIIATRGLGRRRSRSFGRRREPTDQV